MLGDRQSAVAALASAVNILLFQRAAGRAERLDRIQVRDECMRTLNSLMAYLYTKQDIYFNDALRRVLNLASWDPRGSTSYAKRGSGFALPCLDAHPRLRLVIPPTGNTDQRNLLIAAILARGTDMSNDGSSGCACANRKVPRDCPGDIRRWSCSR